MTLQNILFTGGKVHGNRKKGHQEAKWIHIN